MPKIDITLATFTPKELVGIAMSRMGKLLHGDESTNWRGMLKDDVDEDVAKELTDIVEILQSISVPTEKAMSEAEVEAYGAAEIATAAELIKKGARDEARARLTHVKVQLAAAAKSFAAGDETAKVKMFSPSAKQPGDTAAALAKTAAEQLVDATPEPEPTPEPTADAAPEPSTTEATPESEPTTKDEDDEEEWPTDMASAAEIKKARDIQMGDPLG